MRDRGFLIVLDPSAKALYVEVRPVAADFIRDRPLGEALPQGGVCLIPGFFITWIGVVLDTPFRPAGIFFFAGEHILAEFDKYGAG